jgi:hypothetical protein
VTWNMPAFLFLYPSACEQYCLEHSFYPVCNLPSPCACVSALCMGWSGACLFSPVGCLPCLLLLLLSSCYHPSLTILHAYSLFPRLWSAVLQGWARSGTCSLLGLPVPALFTLPVYTAGSLLWRLPVSLPVWRLGILALVLLICCWCKVVAHILRSLPSYVLPSEGLKVLLECWAPGVVEQGVLPSWALLCHLPTPFCGVLRMEHHGRWVSDGNCYLPIACAPCCCGGSLLGDGTLGAELYSSACYYLASPVMCFAHLFATPYPHEWRCRCCTCLLTWKNWSVPLLEVMPVFLLVGGLGLVSRVNLEPVSACLPCQHTCLGWAACALYMPSTF